MRRRRWKRASLLAALLLAAAMGLLPWVDVPALAPALKDELSRSLGRRVELEKVRCSVFPVPALVASNLVIEEDAAFGLEPFAYADRLRASVSLPALLRGALALREVRLDGASVNVVRLEQAGFNLGAFLKKLLAPGKVNDIPKFSLRQSRINFRTGTVKSAYYLNGVDLDVEPPRSEGGEFRWRYEASPARTDRSEQGFGRFTGSGRWMPGLGGGRFAVDVELERSAMSELAQLVAGRDIGLQGRFTVRTFADGPLNALELRGQIEMEDLERPAFFGLRSRNIQLPFAGLLDLDAQSISLQSAPSERGRSAAPLKFRLEGSGLLTSPRWLAELGFENLPAPALLDICHRLGLSAPKEAAVEGAVSGSARFASGAPASGELRFPSLSLRFGGEPSVELTEGWIRLQGDALTLESARIVTPGRAEAAVRGRWNLATGELSFEAATEEMEIPELNGALKVLPALGPLPVLENCATGTWRGRLVLSKEPGDSPGQDKRAWSGRIGIANARCQPQGFRSPLLVRKAALELAGAGWRLREGELLFAGTPVRVSARFEPSAQPTLSVGAEVERLEGSQIESLLQMAQAPPRGLFQRTLRRRAEMPGWLRRLHVRGTVKAGLVVLGRQEFEHVEASFVWRGAHARFDGLRARWKGAELEGVVEAALWREEPEYRVRAAVSDLETGAGTIDAELEASTPTLRPGLERRVRGWAETCSPLLRLPGGVSLRELRAALTYDGERGRNPWRLNGVSFWLDGHFWSGRGEASSEGVARVWFASPSVRWEGSLWPPALAPAGH